MTNPIYYKLIPTQYAFFVQEKDGKYEVQTRQLTVQPAVQIFNSKKEATAFIKRKYIL